MHKIRLDLWGWSCCCAVNTQYSLGIDDKGVIGLRIDGALLKRFIPIFNILRFYLYMATSDISNVGGIWSIYNIILAPVVWLVYLR